MIDSCLYCISLTPSDISELSSYNLCRRLTDVSPTNLLPPTSYCRATLFQGDKILSFKDFGERLNFQGSPIKKLVKNVYTVIPNVIII